jgi:hypothetical protein
MEMDRKSEKVRALAISGTMELINMPMWVVQAGIAAGLLALTWEIPKPYLPYMAMGILALAYATGPRIQAQALREEGCCNDLVVTSFYQGQKSISNSENPNPYPAIIAGTAKAWTIGYVTNGANWIANTMALKEDRVFWVNFMSQVLVGWGLTMVFNTAILNGRTRELTKLMAKLKIIHV